MTSAVLADAQFGIARILKPSKEALGRTVAYEIAESFTVPPTPETSFTVTTATSMTGLNGGKYVTIPMVGTFKIVSAVGTALVLETAPSPVEFGWQTFNQVGTFSAGTHYVASGTYRDRPGNIPMMWTEGGLALDPNAGKSGYSNKLVRGLPVPMGARLLVWVPEIEGCSLEWNFGFRVRNLLDYKNTRNPYHLAAQRIGPDNLVPVPGVWQNAIYNDATSSPCKPLATQTVVRETFVSADGGVEDFSFPLIPNTVSLSLTERGVMEQGILSASNAPQFSFRAIELQSLGDEIIVSCSLAEGVDTIWSSSLVMAMRNLFDAETAPYNGVYVFAGSAP